MKRTVQLATPNGRRSVSQPQWSIVLSWRGGLSLLESRLAGLSAATRHRAQLIVVRTSSIAADPLPAFGFSNIQVVAARPGADRRELRELGLLRASGGIVSFLDDSSPPVQWDRLSFATQRVRSDPELIALESPDLSVIVPARNCADMLRQSLTALENSDVDRERWELIVVDDCSHDRTAEIASSFADHLVRLRGSRPLGPAYARNRGAEIAIADTLVFVDADLCVHSDALRHILETLDKNTDVSAVFGTYDDQPRAPGLVSSYRNLLEHYLRKANPGEAHTFWEACGAVRRPVFERAGMYDEWRFLRPQIEGLELARRLRQLNYRILSDPEIQGTHLKRWTLLEMLRSDLRDRGIPWMRLIGRDATGSTRELGGTRRTRRACATLTWIGVGMAAAGILAHIPTMGYAAVVLLLSTVAVNRRQYTFFARRRGVAFAIATVPLDLLTHFGAGLAIGLGAVMRELIGEPLREPRLHAMVEIGVKTWPPVPSQRTS